MAYLPDENIIGVVESRVKYGRKSNLTQACKKSKVLVIEDRPCSITFAV